MPPPRKLVGSSDPYGFEPAFERLVAVRSCASPAFWSRIGNAVDVDCLALDESKLAIQACTAIAKDSGSGPAGNVIVIQRLRTWQREGKVTGEQVQAVRDMLLDGFDAVESDEALIAELAPVIKRRIEKNAVDQALSAYGKKGDLSGVKALLDRAERVGKAETTAGTRLDHSAFDAIRRLRSLKRLPTGVDELDAVIGGGMPRGSLGIAVGGTGDGKSMFLGHQAATGVVNGLGVAYITLELSEEDIIARITANLTCIPTEDILLDDLATMEAQDRLTHLINGGYLGYFTVKEMTPHATTVADIEAWLDAEYVATGIPIDLLCVDYGDLLTDTTKKVAHEIATACFEGLRVSSVRRKIWVWTGAQSNAAGADKKKTKVMDVQHIGGSMGKARTADLVVTLNRDEEEGLTFRVAKNRRGQGGVNIGPIPVDFEYGRLCPTTREGWPW